MYIVSLQGQKSLGKNGMVLYTLLRSLHITIGYSVGYRVCKVM